MPEKFTKQLIFELLLASVVLLDVVQVVDALNVIWITVTFSTQGFYQ